MPLVSPDWPKSFLLVTALAAVAHLPFQEATAASFAENPLPFNLEEPQEGEPEVPVGLQAADDDREPGLPAGLGPAGADDGAGVDSFARSTRAFREFGGFLDLRSGSRLRDDPDEPQQSLGELRLQLNGKIALEWITARAVVDVVHDYLAEGQELDLDTSEGSIDLRTLDFVVSPVEFADLRIGRQALTWGVGDLLFLNDLFPKDWNAFFLGRDLEYLKAPADVARLSLFFDDVTVDVVYGPRFNADRFLDRRRLSSFDPIAGEISGADTPLPVDRPDRWFVDDELAVRLARTVGSWELAAYGYQGFWKSPEGFDPDLSVALFPRLLSGGVSARGPWRKGILSLEGASYRSIDDPGGDEPYLPNSRWLFLAGYERELTTDLIAGIQYMGTFIRQHEEYLQNLPDGTPAAAASDHLMTLRLSWQNRAQMLRLSLFSMWGITEGDGYLRPHVSYALSDSWRLETGANVLHGDQPHSRFGQLERNTNLWGAVRYSF